MWALQMATGVLAVSRDIFAGLYKMTVEGVLEIKPSPDWKGRGAVAVRQWRRKPEPCKAGNAKKSGRHGVADTV